MADNDKKPFAHLLPAILTGLAALIAALTGVYVNLRDDKSGAEPVIARTATPAKVPVDASAAALPKATKFRLHLDRIAVQNDGSIGTTDWRFAVEANGQPLFVFGQDDLDDTGGRNVATLEDIGAMLRTSPGETTRITVKGWRGSRLRVSPGAPDVEGEGVLGESGVVAPIAVSGKNAEAGAFIVYFSATAE